jgi:3-phenylpropionate/trans-cinnamate dioxygenase ferredoxin reductase subunit
MNTSTIVIIGGGQAGYQVAASLRQEGHTGSITIVGDEPGVPYQRPPLSKAYLLGKVTAAALRLRPPEWFETQQITRVQDEVRNIDREGRSVLLASGAQLPYDHLVLATGARNRVPNVPGVELDGVLGIRTLADADALSPRLADVRHAVVIGAGFIGLEFAAVAAARGIAVHVLELADRPMARALSQPMSELFTQAHAGWGVTLDFKNGLKRIVGDNGRVTGVETEDGRLLPADLVIYGIGVIANSELAAQAGLNVANGIVVDEQLLTNDPSISAIGDVANFPSPHLGTMIRLESVQNAVDQARTVAARLTGKPARYAALPWFWTDQGDLKLQIVGLSEGHDHTVLLGDPAARQLSVLCFRHGQLVAVESANRPADHMAARKILARPAALTAAQASEPGFDLKAWELSSRPAAA